jgi:hypothetical protein
MTTTGRPCRSCDEHLNKRASARLNEPFCLPIQARARSSSELGHDLQQHVTAPSSSPVCYGLQHRLGNLDNPPFAKRFVASSLAKHRPPEKNFTCRVRQSAFTTCTACPLPPNRHDSTLSIPCSAVDRFTDFMKHHRSVLAQWETGPFRAIPYLLCYPGSSSRPAQSCAFPYRPARWHKGHSTKVTKGAPRYPKRQQAPASAGRSSCPTCAGGSIKRVCSIGPQTTGTRHKEDLAPPGNRTPTSSVGGMNPNH